MSSGKTKDKTEDVVEQDAKPGRSRMNLFWTVGNGLGAVAVGVFFLFFSGRGDESTAADDAPDEQVEAVTEERIALPSERIVQADAMLAEGSFAVAAQIYRRAIGDQQNVSAPLRYRVAVCTELLGEYEEAMRRYRDLATASEEMYWPSLLGQARVRLAQDRWQESRDLLAKMAAVSARHDQIGPNIAEDVSYLLAMVRSRRALRRLPAELLSLNSVAFLHARFPVEHLLALVEKKQSPTGDPLAEIPVGIQVQVGGHPASMIVSARFENRSTLEALESLSDQAGWQLSISEDAATLFRDRQTSAYLRDATGAELLLLLLEPLDLEWSLEGGELRITHTDGLTSGQGDAIASARATQSLRSVLAISPNHTLAPVAHLALGNLAFAHEEYDRAEARYREIAQRFSSHPSVQAATFNLAKIMYRQQRMPEALETFYRVVDFGFGSELEPAAYLFLGRLHMEADDGKSAIRELYRALAKSSDDGLTAVASLTLATAHLLQEPPATHVANSELMTYRGALTVESHREIAALLSAWARYLSAGTRQQLRTSGRDLVSSLVHVSPDDFFGSAGYLLLGNIYQELGLTGQVTSLYREALELGELPEDVRPGVQFRLATRLIADGNFEESQGLLDEIRNGDSRWAGPALVHLAQNAITQQLPDDCMRWCRIGLDESQFEPQRRELLKLMGQAYELRGDHYNAAICFSGLAPTKTVGIQSEVQP